MIATLTNILPIPINGLDKFIAGTGYVGTSATGGTRTHPLPYPFSHVGEVAPSASVVLPVHPRDFRHRDVRIGSPFDAGEEWQQVIQLGEATLSFAAETGRRDTEELFVASV